MNQSTLRDAEFESNSITPYHKASSLLASVRKRNPNGNLMSTGKIEKNTWEDAGIQPVKTPITNGKALQIYYEYKNNKSITMIKLVENMSLVTGEGNINLRALITRLHTLNKRTHLQSEGLTLEPLLSATFQVSKLSTSRKRKRKKPVQKKKSKCWQTEALPEELLTLDSKPIKPVNLMHTSASKVYVQKKRGRPPKCRKVYPTPPSITVMCVYCLRESKNLKYCDFCANTLSTSSDNDIKENQNYNGDSILEYHDYDGHNPEQANTNLTDRCTAKSIPFIMSQLDGCVDSNCDIIYDTPNTNAVPPPAAEPDPPCDTDSCGTLGNLSQAPSTMGDSVCSIINCIEQSKINNSDTPGPMPFVSLAPNNCDSNYIVIPDTPNSKLSATPDTKSDSTSNTDSNCIVISDTPSSKLSGTPNTKTDSPDNFDSSCIVISETRTTKRLAAPSTKTNSANSITSKSAHTQLQIPTHPLPALQTAICPIVIAPIPNADVLHNQPQVMDNRVTDPVSVRRQLWPNDTPLLPPPISPRDKKPADDSIIFLNVSHVRIGTRKLSVGSSVSLMPNGFEIMHGETRVIFVAADKVISCLVCLDTSFPAFFFLVESSCFKYIREACNISAIEFNSTSPVVNTRCITVIPQRLTPEDVVATLRCFNASDGSYFPQVLLPIDTTEVIDILYGDRSAAMQQKATKSNGPNGENGFTKCLSSSVNSYDNWMQQQLAHEQRKRVREEEVHKKKVQEQKRKQLQGVQKPQQNCQQLKELQQNKVDMKHNSQPNQLSNQEQQQMAEQLKIQHLWKCQQEQLKRQEDQVKMTVQQQIHMAHHLQQLVAELQIVQYQLVQLLQQPISQQLEFAIHQLTTQEKILQHQIIQQQILQQQLMQETQKQQKISFEQKLQQEFSYGHMQSQQIGQRQKQQRREQQRQQQKQKQQASQQQQQHTLAHMQHKMLEHLQYEHHHM